MGDYAYLKSKLNATVEFHASNTKELHKNMANWDLFWKKILYHINKTLSFSFIFVRYITAVREWPLHLKRETIPVQTRTAKIRSRTPILMRFCWQSSRIMSQRKLKVWDFFFVFKYALCWFLKSGQLIIIWCKILIMTCRLIYLCLHDDES